MRPSLALALCVGAVAVAWALPAMAQAVPGPASPSPVPLPRLNIGITPASKPQDVAFSLQILLVLTILTLAPTLLVLLTSFTISARSG